MCIYQRGKNENARFVQKLALKIRMVCECIQNVVLYSYGDQYYAYLLACYEPPWINSFGWRAYQWFCGLRYLPWGYDCGRSSVSDGDFDCLTEAHT